MRSIAIPNFFIAGAAKAGTTSLYSYLAQHPEVFVSPVKEPSYFSFEARPENFVPKLQAQMAAQMAAVKERLESGRDGHRLGGVVGCWSDYLRLFEGVRGERAVGEASVCYLWSRTAAKEIAAVNPEAKIVLVLRHPAERAFSQYLHYLSDGHVAHSFQEHIDRSLQRGSELSEFHPFLEFGMYHEQVERYLRYFPREQVRVWLYEDTLAEPSKFHREVMEFLEVDPAFVPDTSRRFHQMEIPRALRVSQALRRSGAWRTLRGCVPAGFRPIVKRMIYRQRGELKMSAEDRRFLTLYYTSDVVKLGQLIDRDLSAWLH